MEGTVVPHYGSYSQAVTDGHLPPPSLSALESCQIHSLLAGLSGLPTAVPHAQGI